MTWGKGGRIARVGEAWKERRAMDWRWASSWRESRAGRNEVAIVYVWLNRQSVCNCVSSIDSRCWKRGVCDWSATSTSGKRRRARKKVEAAKQPASDLRLLFSRLHILGAADHWRAACSIRKEANDSSTSSIPATSASCHFHHPLPPISAHIPRRQQWPRQWLLVGSH